MDEEIKEDFLDRRTLYVGSDDSNNHDDRMAQIVAATFSFSKGDSLIKGFPRKRNKQDLCYWLSNDSENRDFRFALLTEPCFRHMQPILPLAVPRLILDYVPTLPEIPKKVWICIDGIAPREHKEYIRKYLSHYFEEVVVNNVVKRDNEMARKPKNERLSCPTILKMADLCANQIYDLFSSEHLEEMVQINQSALKELYEKLRTK